MTISGYLRRCLGVVHWGLSNGHARYWTTKPRTLTRPCCSSSVLPMESIPGPRRWPLVGTAWTYFPLLGRDDWHELHKVYLEQYLKYGKIVREQILGKVLVSVFDPVDIETVFRNEGRYPTRIGHEVQLAIRRRNPEMYATGGLFPTNGEEWGKLRRSYQREVSGAHAISDYLPNLETIAREFNEYLRSCRAADGIVPDLLYKMHEWALESVSANVLDARLDDFKPNRKSLCHELITGAYDGLLALGNCEYLPYWRLMKSKDYKAVLKMDHLFYRVSQTYVEKKWRALKDEDHRSTAEDPTSRLTVLDRYLRNPENELRDVITVTADLLFTGLITTAISASFILYHLSRNLEKQELLFREVKSRLPHPNAKLAIPQLDGMTYLKACVKEAMRLNPVALGTNRVVSCDVVLAGYKIPAGTFILTQNQVASMLPEYVEDPARFLPERWLRDGDHGCKRLHPYLVLPFGAGPRGCIGRRFAELETYVFLALFVRKFRIEWQGEGEVGMETQLINIPSGTMEIKFFDREEE